MREDNGIRGHGGGGERIPRAWPSGVAPETVGEGEPGVRGAHREVLPGAQEPICSGVLTGSGKTVWSN